MSSKASPVSAQPATTVRPTAMPEEICTEAARLEHDARRPLERGPRGRKDAPKRHVGKEAKHEEANERAHIAAASASEIAAGAAACEHHAKAQHQSAKAMAGPIDAGSGEVHRLVEADPAPRLQQLRAH